MNEKHIDLSSVTVLDASTLLAGPLSMGMLADLGANVIKVEAPTGDPLRGYPPFRNGVSLIHKVTNRGKRAITCDLRKAEGQELFRKLAQNVDVVAVNFRPQTLKKWGIDFDTLSKINPRLVFLHISAFGRTGPYHERPGFARIAEGFAGLAGITGFADREPVLNGYPIVDAMTGVYGAYAVASALYSRAVTGKGALIDLALYEPLLRTMEDLVVGLPSDGRSRMGNANPYVVPNNLYLCADGEYIIIAASTDNIFSRLTQALGHPELASDPRFVTNEQRVINRIPLDALIAAFAGTRSSGDLLATLREHEVAAGPVHLPGDIPGDPHIRERGNLVMVHDEESGEDLRMQAPIPLGAGTIRFPGRALGEDNESVYKEILGLSPEDVRTLVASGAI